MGNESSLYLNLTYNQTTRMYLEKGSMFILLKTGKSVYHAGLVQIDLSDTNYSWIKTISKISRCIDSNATV